MVTVGFLAVLEWDALAFNRRDAKVLGPLPLPGSTIIGAKLAARLIKSGALSLLDENG